MRNGSITKGIITHRNFEGRFAAFHENIRHLPSYSGNERYEKAALNGAKKVVAQNQDLICAICSYHCTEDEEWINDYFSKIGYVTDHSRGFMCPDWSIAGRLDAELRRGIVFAKKQG